MENAGSGGKRRVSKMRGLVENAGLVEIAVSGGKCGVWKTQGLVRNVRSVGKCRVWWKTQ